MQPVVLTAYLYAQAAHTPRRTIIIYSPVYARVCVNYRRRACIYVSAQSFVRVIQYYTIRLWIGTRTIGILVCIHGGMHNTTLLLLFQIASAFSKSFSKSPTHTHTNVPVSSIDDALISMRMLNTLVFFFFFLQPAHLKIDDARVFIIAPCAFELLYINYISRLMMGSEHNADYRNTPPMTLYIHKLPFIQKAYIYMYNVCAPKLYTPY